MSLVPLINPIELEINLTRPNEFGSMTARKGDIKPLWGLSSCLVQRNNLFTYFTT